MPFILVKVKAEHIATTPARGYGPRIIIAALRDRLVQGVYIAIDTCWVMVIHKGVRVYVHLPLRILPYTYRHYRTPLLDPITFRIPMPAEFVRPRSRAARKLPP